MTQINLSTKQKQTRRHREQCCDCQGGEGEEGGWSEWEFGISRCKLLQMERISNKVLMYGTAGYMQSPGINHSGKEHKKERVYTYN